MSQHLELLHFLIESQN